jgi:hypothetical protein
MPPPAIPGGPLQLLHAKNSRLSTIISIATDFSLPGPACLLPGSARRGGLRLDLPPILRENVAQALGQVTGTADFCRLPSRGLENLKVVNYEKDKKPV